MYAGDVDGLAPALFIADDAVQTRRTNDPDYIEDLLGLVDRLDISLIVPTIDSDLPILAAHEASFRRVGCLVAVSAASFVGITLDKHQSGVTFGTAGIRVPVSWLPPVDRVEQLPQRLFVKPRRGSASQDTYVIDRHDLDAILHMVPDPIVQEVLLGPEITIDAFLDLDGRPIHFVPRRRIRTLGGESIQGVTLDHDVGFEEWIENVLAVCSTLGAVGPLTLQAFLTPDGPVLSEINPRFGGGFPLAHAAGADYPAWLMDLARGGTVPPRLRQYESGLYMTRYNLELFTRQPKW